MFFDNPLLCTDIYKTGHMEQYPKDTAYIYSYLHTRSAHKYKKVMMFGLQYYLKRYLMKPITTAHIREFDEYRRHILGSRFMVTPGNPLYDLRNLGYWPLAIRAIPEGMIVDNPNCLMTVENTLPGYHWCVGFVESLLLKLWNTCTVATYSLELRKLLEKYNNISCDDPLLTLPYQIHDFGYRGCSSEETAALSGAAHLINFLGSDTVPAVALLREYYRGCIDRDKIGKSVPATEHSVMTAYGPAQEPECFAAMMNIYPEGILSVVSDSYDLFRCIREVSLCYHNDIVKRNGRLVFRPDSGDPYKILLGDPDGITEEEKLGVYRLLDKLYGSKLNSKGYKVLNPHVGAIYGDAMYYDRINVILRDMLKLGYSSENFYAGVGGLLLQSHSRDDMGFSFKASELTKTDGTKINLFKMPKTDMGKKSQGGRFSVIYSDIEQKYITVPETEETKANCVMHCFYDVGLRPDHNRIWDMDLEMIRHNASVSR